MGLQATVGRIWFAYENEQKKGASKEELAKLLQNYSVNAKVLRSQLEDILTVDSGHSDTLYVLATLSRWEGDNRQAYFRFRDALSSDLTRNIFKYQQRLNTVQSQEMKLRYLQDLAPKETIIQLPTAETSPFLRFIKRNVDSLIDPAMAEGKKAYAREIEKFSRGSSLVDELTGMSAPEN